MNSHLVISGVDENLVDNLEETGNICEVTTRKLVQSIATAHAHYIPIHHAFSVRIIAPHFVGNKLFTADVRVWSFQNMFNLSHLATKCGSAQRMERIIEPNPPFGTCPTRLLPWQVLWVLPWVPVHRRDQREGQSRRTRPRPWHHCR